MDLYKPTTRSPSLNRFFTYFYPASGADLCNGTSTIALEIVTWVKNTTVNSSSDHFTFFILSQDSSGILSISYSATVNSKLMPSNCTDGIYDRKICYSYISIHSMQGQSNIKYIGISNLQAASTLMALPNIYTTNYYHYYYWRTRLYFESDFMKLNLTKGSVPALRIYYSKCSRPIQTTQMLLQ